MAITDKIVTKERLAYFKSKLDAMLTAWTVKSVKRNGTTLTPDANGVVNVITAEITIHNHDDPQGGMDKIINDIIIRGGTTESGAVGGSISFYENMYNTDLITMHVEGSQVSDGVLHRSLATQEYVDDAMAGAGDENVIEIVKVNGSALVPDENKAVNVIVNQIDVGRTNKGAANETDYARFARVMNDGSYSDKLAFFYDKATDEFRALFETQGDFENDLEVQLASRSYVNTAITTELAGVTQIDFVKVSDVASLPATGVKGTFYLVPNTGSGRNVYDEYVWVNKGTTENPDYAYENLGPQALDLSGYVQESDLNEITTAEIDAMFA